MRRDEGTRERGGGLPFWVFLIGAILVIGALSDNEQSRPQPPKRAEPARASSSGSSDLRRLVVARRDVRERLRDPSSAEFSRMVVRGEVVCGYVNSRNGFGGMNGPEPFITRAGVIAAFPSDMPPGEFQEVWERVC